MSKMERITAAVLLALALPAMAGAAIPDISDLSREELIELDQRIHLRLFDEQLIEGVPVPSGEYIIGRDIPAGTYRIDFSGGSEMSSGRFFVYNADGSVNSWHFVGKAEDVSEIGKIELLEGQQIEILYISSTFYAYTGLFH